MNTHNEAKTPETDKAIKDCNGECAHCFIDGHLDGAFADHARRLERERDEARRERDEAQKRYEKQCEGTHSRMSEIVALRAEVAELRNQLEIYRGWERWQEGLWLITHSDGHKAEFVGTKDELTELRKDLEFHRDGLMRVACACGVEQPIVLTAFCEKNSDTYVDCLINFIRKCGVKSETAKESQS